MMELVLHTDQQKCEYCKRTIYSGNTCYILTIGATEHIVCSKKCGHLYSIYGADDGR
jgi:ribosomal protein L24E